MALFKVLSSMSYNKKIKSLTSFAGTHTRGLLRIIAHMPAPLSLKLEGVSLNYVWLNKKISTTSLTCCFKHRPSIGSLLNSMVRDGVTWEEKTV
ncbi:hypothetical protein AV939_02680 [Alteromonas sp. Mac1]|nr:hypothetical protein AV939_02680 [Alteromonas sp. Mac1]